MNGCTSLRIIHCDDEKVIIVGELPDVELTIRANYLNEDCSMEISILPMVFGYIHNIPIRKEPYRITAGNLVNGINTLRRMIENISVSINGDSATYVEFNMYPESIVVAVARSTRLTDSIYTTDHTAEYCDGDDKCITINAVTEVPWYFGPGKTSVVSTYVDGGHVADYNQIPITRM